MPKVLNGNLDALKVVLAICVVALHCKVFGGNDTAIGYMLGNGLFRVAVPVFFIINGYYLFHTLSEAIPSASGSSAGCGCTCSGC